MSKIRYNKKFNNKNWRKMKKKWNKRWKKIKISIIHNLS